MTRPHTDAVPEHEVRYGLGFWLVGPLTALYGSDYGVSFASTYDPTSGTVSTVIANVETPIQALVHRMQELAATS